MPAPTCCHLELLARPRPPPKLSLWQQLREKFEPSVPSTTIVNEGSIFVALALWAAWQVREPAPAAAGQKRRSYTY